MKMKCKDYRLADDWTLEVEEITFFGLRKKIVKYAGFPDSWETYPGYQDVTGQRVELLNSIYDRIWAAIDI